LLDWPEGQRAALEGSQPRFERRLIDLARLSMEELKGSAEARLAQGVLKAAMEDDLLEWADWAIPLLLSALPAEFLGALLSYVINVDSSLDLQKLAARVRSGGNSTAAATIMSSLADRIRAEAIALAEQRVRPSVRLGAPRRG